MADRCDHCSVRMDGLEVHADDCPVRGPEIVAESEKLKGENAALQDQLEAANLEIEELKGALDDAEGEHDALQEKIRKMELQAGEMKKWCCSACGLYVANDPKFLKTFEQKEASGTS